MDTFRSCPYEDLVSPDRVHVDAFGHVRVCQGISIGNVWETPLSAVLREYDAARHPICGPLVRGGPAALAVERGVAPDGSYVDECHYCYALRRSLIADRTLSGIAHAAASLRCRHPRRVISERA